MLRSNSDLSLLINYLSGSKCTLKVLDVSASEGGSGLASASLLLSLLAAVSKNKTLTELNISRHSLCSSSISLPPPASLIPTGSTPTSNPPATNDFKYSNLTATPGGIAIANVIVGCSSMTTLLYSGNNCCVGDYIAVEQAMKTSTSLCFMSFNRSDFISIKKECKAAKNYIVPNKLENTITAIRAVLRKNDGSGLSSSTSSTSLSSSTSSLSLSSSAASSKTNSSTLADTQSPATLPPPPPEVIGATDAVDANEYDLNQSVAALKQTQNITRMSLSLPASFLPPPPPPMASTGGSSPTASAKPNSYDIRQLSRFSRIVNTSAPISGGASTGAGSYPLPPPSPTPSSSSSSSSSSFPASFPSTNSPVTAAPKPFSKTVVAAGGGTGVALGTSVGNKGTNHDKIEEIKIKINQSKDAEEIAELRRQLESLREKA